MKKSIGIVLLLFTCIIGVLALNYSNGDSVYSECIVDEYIYEDIISERLEHDGLIEKLIFDEQTLFLENSTKTFYYSLVEGNASAYSPYIEVKSDEDNVKVVFLNGEITDEGIENNRTITLLAYSDEYFCKYYLKCTTLPLLNIECDEEITRTAVPMTIEVFDNQEGCVKRITTSEGTIKVRGSSTRSLPKVSYRISLTQQSLGDNKRKNNVSLLGMRQDDDWILYTPYNDQEKIRNVFSSNLWTETCGTDNAEGINTGNQYKYIEVFLNGEYYGLYALGYPLDEKLFELDGSENQVFYKYVNWFHEQQITLSENTVKGFEIKNVADIKDELQGWSMLLEYYYALEENRDNNENLYKGIDIDNVIDCYLFINMVQGLDNAQYSKVKNMYVRLKANDDTITALYAPWDMDLAWGNEFSEDYSINRVSAYSLQPEDNLVQKSGYLNQIFINEPEQTWEKITNKYWDLRTSGWSDENLNRLIDKYESEIFGSGAYLREMEKWPNGSYVSVEQGLSVFREYVMKRMQTLDEYYMPTDEYEAFLGTEYEFSVNPVGCTDLGLYLLALSYTDYNVILEVNDSEVLLDETYLQLFENLGVNTQTITSDTDFIIIQLEEKCVEYFEDVITHTGGVDSSIGYFEYIVDEQTKSYEVYLNDELYYTVLPDQQSDADIRIILIDKNTMDVLDNRGFYGDKTEN